MKKSRILRNIIKWCFSIFCFLCGIATISNPNFGSVLFLLLASAELPIKPMDELWGKIIRHPAIRILKRILFLILFVIAAYFVPTDSTGKQATDQELQQEELTGNAATLIVENKQDSDAGQSKIETTQKSEGSGQSKEASQSQNEIAGQNNKDVTQNSEGSGQSKEQSQSEIAGQNKIEEAKQDEFAEQTTQDEADGLNQEETPKQENAASSSTITMQDIPAYAGNPYTIINGNQPFFSESELVTEPFESYSDLDALGRCGVAYANICIELMPTEERGAIGMIKPSGWQTVKYDFVDGKYLYNRCHLIGFQLAGENANTKNLITGTRYFNTIGMLPFENQIAAYVERTDNHVLYRVTPIYEGENLVASGVLMEAESVEDKGEGICFHVFCYNVQPGVAISYADGTSREDGSAVFLESTKKPVESTTSQSAESKAETPTSQPEAAPAETPTSQPEAAPAEAPTSQPEAAPTEAASSKPAESTTEISPFQPEAETPVSTGYVLNTNSHKFHRTDCNSVDKIKPENRQDVNWSKAECEAAGYVGCKNCNP